ncbi:MAG: UDP-N-acetylmuramoyl-tripeptide--D-alanyl-D-alanine ligase [Acidobacteriota bacterium]
MIELSVAEVAETLNAQVKGSTRETLSPFPSISIDSRTLQAGQCFIALRGQRFDGHDFLGDALREGASIIIYSEDSIDSSDWKDRVFLQVADTRAALQILAHYVRKKWGQPLLAVSGSMGKTTTREFTATLLGEKFKVFQSPGNLNNEIGVPLSLLRLTEQHQLAILELGMNHPGEIRALAKICCPDSALLTNVAAVHLEFFSDLDEIAAAKGEILEFLPPKGRFFFNADDSRLSHLASTYAGQKVSFALENQAEVRVLNYRFEGVEKMSFEIDARGESLTASVPFVGKHLLYNIAAAVAVALSFGLAREELCREISQLKLPCMRGQIRRLGPDKDDPITLWDDSYNSNPRALAMVLDAVSELRGFRRKILALGEMLELGQSSLRLHRQAGGRVAQCKVDLLVTVGTNGIYIGEGAKEKGFSPEKIMHFKSSQEAAEFLVRHLGGGDFLLVKGSRRVQMERITQKIEEKKAL